MWAQKLCRVLPGMRKEKMSSDDKAFFIDEPEEVMEELVPETERLRSHREFMYRMVKAHRHVMEALVGNELETARFLTIAILSDWEDFVWDDFNESL